MARNRAQEPGHANRALCRLAIARSFRVNTGSAAVSSRTPRPLARPPGGREPAQPCIVALQVVEGWHPCFPAPGVHWPGRPWGNRPGACGICRCWGPPSLVETAWRGPRAGNHHGTLIAGKVHWLGNVERRMVPRTRGSCGDGFFQGHGILAARLNAPAEKKTRTYRPPWSVRRANNDPTFPL
jgi:hypothetical protein